MTKGSVAFANIGKDKSEEFDGETVDFAHSKRS